MHNDTKTLGDKLLAFKMGFLQRLPEAERRRILEASDDLRASRFDWAGPHDGDVAPDFTLPDQHGLPVRLADRLQRGPVVLLFVRGGWCPFCTLTLRAYQDALPAIQEAGGDLLAITPQPADSCSVMAERDLLAFPTLSDRDNRVGDGYGVVYELAPLHRELYKRLGHDPSVLNRTGDWRLPLPATFIIGRDSRVLRAHVEPVAHRRLEPSAAVATLREAHAVA